MGDQVRKLIGSVVVLAIVVAAVGASYSAFTATTSNTGNTIAAGTVAVGNDDSGAAMFNVSNIKPGDTVSKCIKVTYTGSLSSTIRLYGSSSGALAPYLNVTVTRGSNAGTFPACSFTADGTDYLGSGAGVIYTGGLSSFPSSYASAIVDPVTGSPETWTTSETHAYQFTISVANNSAAQGLSGSTSFTWEARNQ